MYTFYFGDWLDNNELAAYYNSEAIANCRRFNDAQRLGACKIVSNLINLAQSRYNKAIATDNCGYIDGKYVNLDSL